jgi:exonuclease III
MGDSDYEDDENNTNKNCVCLRKNTLQEFWFESKNLFLPIGSYVKYNICHVNIRSIRANFRSLIASFNDQINNLDVLILSEINCQAEDVAKFSIKNYRQLAKPRSQGRGGGLLFYVRESFKVQDFCFKFDQNVAESSGVILNNEILIVAFYRPPSKSKPEFNKQLDNFLQKESIKFSNIVICGDININLKEDSDVNSNYISTLSEHGFSSCISFSTRAETTTVSSSATLIDHIFLKTNKFDAISSVIVQKIADHFPTILTLYEVERERPPLFRVKTDFKQLNKDLSRFKWKKCAFDKNNVNETFDNVSRVIKTAHEVNTYTEEVRHNKFDKRFNKNWVTEKLKVLIAERDRLFRRMRSNKTNKLYQIEYKKFRNKLNCKLKNAERTFNINKLKSCQGNIKETWSVLNGILGRTRNSLDENITRYMSKYYSAEEILSGFGQHFSQAANANSHKCDFRALTHTTQTHTLQCLYLPPAKFVHIEYIVKRLNKKKGPGHDSVTVTDVQNAGEKLIDLLTNTLNTCIKLSIFPDPLKIALIRPLYKAGIHKIFDNYRPISILPVFDKIFEKYLDFHLSNFLKDFNIIDQRQFAYQKGRNVNELFSDLSDYINDNISKKHHTAAIFIDYKKAFDVIDHNLLLKKLHKIGIQGPVLNLFKSYLSNRKFAVMINGEKSELFDITSGVPQGSILGCKLFIIYMLDLFQVVKNCKIVMFADDVCLLFSDPVFKTCNQILQKEFDSVIEWSHDNNICINMKKTVCMHFCLKSLRKDEERLNLICHEYDCLHRFQVNCNCDALAQVKNCVYLGLHLDEDFTWKLHIKHLVSKLRSVVRELTFAKANLTHGARRILYFSLAHSHLHYGITAWGVANLTSLLNIQERLLYKMCSEKDKNSVENLFKFWNVLPVDKVFEFNILVSRYFDNHGTLRQHSHNTRSSQFDVYFEPRSENSYAERTNQYIVPRLWNSLPQELKTFQSTSIVKRRLKKYFKSNL